eukprot:12409437-Alexandrium_andersonii.AAC.1
MQLAVHLSPTGPPASSGPPSSALWWRANEGEWASGGWWRAGGRWANEKVGGLAVASRPATGPARPFRAPPTCIPFLGPQRAPL